MKKYSDLSIDQKINVRSYISQFKSERPSDFIFKYKDYPITKSLYNSHVEPYFRSYVTYKNEENEEVSKKIEGATLQLLIENTKKFIDLKIK